MLFRCNFMPLPGRDAAITSPLHWDAIFAFATQHDDKAAGTRAGATSAASKVWRHEPPCAVTLPLRCRYTDAYVARLHASRAFHQGGSLELISYTRYVRSIRAAPSCSSTTLRWSC